MTYALDLLVAILAGATAIPLLMQLKRKNRFVRLVDAEGNPVDMDLPLDSSELQQEIFIPCREGLEPEGEGWEEVEPSPMNYRHGFNVVTGFLLVFAAVLLVSPWSWPMLSVFLACLVLASSGLLIALDLPNWLSLFGEDRAHPIVCIHSAIAIIGLIVAVRLL